MENDILLNDENKPFKNLKEADYLAGMFYPETCYIKIENLGIIKVKSERCGAYSPYDYHYFWIQV